MNFVFISPNYPLIYSHFVKALHDRGVTVLGIGDTPKANINDELKNNLTEYCYVSDMNNIQWMKNTLDYLENKYGHIDYIESNNEYWLMNDALYREYKNVPNGFRPNEMEKIKYKSKMKQYFEKAGVKVARYIVYDNLNQAQEFVKQVGYPIFVKPDNGVGASSSYKIKNDEELLRFSQLENAKEYIMEEYIDGTIVTFDGIVDDDSNALLAYKETFPIPVANVVNDDVDDYYYATTRIEKDYFAMGQNVLKSFGVKKRCFHIEFFKLNTDKEGLGKKGEIVGLEVNMRSPGGDTPDLLSIAIDDSYYDCYADVIAFNKINVNLNKPHYIAISVSKKDRFKYVHNHEEIEANYKDNIIRHGFYDKANALVMGNEFYFARFKSVEEALDFQKFVMKKY